jgi:hypothetical protein
VHQHKWPGVGPRCVVSSLVTHDEL